MAIVVSFRQIFYWCQPVHSYYLKKNCHYTIDFFTNFKHLQARKILAIFLYSENSHLHHKIVIG